MAPRQITGVFAIVLAIAPASASAQAPVSVPPASITGVAASSTLADKASRYAPEHLRDGTWASWCEGKPGDGLGEWVDLTLSAEVKIERLFVKNGFGLRSLFGANNRVMRLDVSGPNGVAQQITLGDSPDPQEISLPKPITARKLRLAIGSVHAGAKYKDTCLAEVSLEPTAIPDDKSLPPFTHVELALSKKQGPDYRIELEAGGKIGGSVTFGAGRLEGTCELIDGGWLLDDEVLSVDANCRFDDVCESPDCCHPRHEDQSVGFEFRRFGPDAAVTREGLIAEIVRWK